MTCESVSGSLSGAWLRSRNVKLERRLALTNADSQYPLVILIERESCNRQNASLGHVNNML